MPLYLIEGNFEQQVAFSKELASAALGVIADEGNRWLFSCLSADKKKMYCLYEAPNPEAVMAARRRLGMPADVIIQVDEIRPEMFA